MDLYVKSKHLRDVTDLLKEHQGNDQKEVDVEGFKLLLSHVDLHVKSVCCCTGTYLSYTGLAVWVNLK